MVGNEIASYFGDGIWFDPECFEHGKVVGAKAHYHRDGSGTCIFLQSQTVESLEITLAHEAAHGLRMRYRPSVQSEENPDPDHDAVWSKILIDWGYWKESIGNNPNRPKAEQIRFRIEARAESWNPTFRLLATYLSLLAPSLVSEVA